MTEFVFSFIVQKISYFVTVAMLLVASMNILQVGYRYGGGATSVLLPVKFTVAYL